jgi:hypothetical protein
MHSRDDARLPFAGGARRREALLIAGIHRADIDVSASPDKLQRRLTTSQFRRRLLSMSRSPTGDRHGPRRCAWCGGYHWQRGRLRRHDRHRVPSVVRGQGALSVGIFSVLTGLVVGGTGASSESAA